MLGFIDFNEATKKVLILAQNEALNPANPSIHVEHLLLGILAHSCKAKVALNNAGWTLNTTRKIIEELFKSGMKPIPQEVGLTSCAKRAIEISVEKAHAAKAKMIQPEHLLLAILDEIEQHNSNQHLTLNYQTIREEVVKLTQPPKTKVLNTKRPFLARPYKTFKITGNQPTPIYENEIQRKIQESLRWQGSRFEIDQALLKAGHNPDEIETAWKSQGITPPHERSRWAMLTTLKNILRVELICGMIFLVWHIANYFVTHSWPLIKQSNTMLQYGLAIHVIMSIGLIYFLCTRASYMHERRLRLSGAITAVIALTGIWLTVGGVFQSPTYVLVNKIEIANKHYMMVHIRDSVSHNFSVFECNQSNSDCFKFDSREYRLSRWYVYFPDGSREYLDYSRFELSYDKDDDRLSIVETAENVTVESFDKAIARK